MFSDAQQIFFMNKRFIWMDKDTGNFDMDIDPQSQSSFLDEKEMEKIWKRNRSRRGLCFGIKCPNFKGTYIENNYYFFLSNTCFFF